MISQFFSFYLDLFLLRLFVGFFFYFCYFNLLNGGEIQFKNIECIINEYKETKSTEIIIPITEKLNLTHGTTKKYHYDAIAKENENELVKINIKLKDSKKDSDTNSSSLDPDSSVPIVSISSTNSSSSGVVGGDQNDTQDPPLSNQAVSSSPDSMDDSSEDGVHHNFIVQENVDTPKGLVDWCLKAAQDNKFLIVTSDDPSHYFPGISDSAQQYLSENCYLLISNPGHMCIAFKIYIRIAIYGVAVCPRLEGDKLIIKWLPVFPGMDFLTSLFEEGAVSNASSYLCDRFLYRTVLDISNQ